MKTTPTLAAALLAALACQAQAEPQGPPHGPPPHPPAPIYKSLDSDGDGTISAEEIAAAAESLRALDIDGDGTVSRDELHPAPPEGAGEAPAGDEAQDPARRPRRPAPPLLAALDGDRDGVLSPAEIEAAPESLTELDRDGDGDLTPREIHPRRPRGGGGPGTGNPPRDR